MNAFPFHVSVRTASMSVLQTVDSWRDVIQLGSVQHARAAPFAPRNDMNLALQWLVGNL